MLFKEWGIMSLENLGAITFLNTMSGPPLAYHDIGQCESAS
ncbi:MAG: hypothetical protein HW403_587 [Dehalococcoidia bacterium]|nr:hypothetical protein [Dehalococcoidia bacterium]